MTARRSLRLALTLAAAGALSSGCVVGPNYHRPAPLPLGQAPPPAFKELAGWTPADPVMADLDKGSWWRVFNDPVLDGLEARVTVSNQTIAQAVATFQQAAALVAENRASFFPTLSSSLDFVRSGSLGAQTVTTSAGGTLVATGGTTSGGTGSTGTTGGVGSTTGTTSTSGTTTTTGTSTSVNTSSGGGGGSNRFNGTLTASWAPDFFGRIRRTVEQARSQAQMSAADLANMTLLAQATLAQDYFQMRALDAQAKVLRETVGDYQHFLKVTQNQFNAGTKARSDVITSQTQLLNAQAQLVDLGVQRATEEHAIAVLVGSPPSGLTLAEGPLPTDVPVAPVGVPGVLLQRRPDIASAERAVQAANAAIGIQVAAYYPTVTLTPSLGSSAGDFFQLFDVNNSLYQLGGSIAQSLVDFGARRARVREARFARDASIAAYRQAVLVAFEGVEDQLSNLRVYQQEDAVRVQDEASARQAARIVQNEYAAGLVDITTVITAQATALSAAQATVQVRGQRLVSAVTLIQDLGGGWSTRDLPKV